LLKEAGWASFLKLCNAASFPEELDELLKLFLTPEERNAIGLRVELIIQLLSGAKTQREISSELEISISKITRGSNALKGISASLREFLVKQFFNQDCPP